MMFYFSHVSKTNYFHFLIYIFIFQLLAKPVPETSIVLSTLTFSGQNQRKSTCITTSFLSPARRFSLNCSTCQTVKSRSGSKTDVPKRDVRENHSSHLKMLQRQRQPKQHKRPLYLMLKPSLHHQVTSLQKLQVLQTAVLTPHSTFCLFH